MQTFQWVIVSGAEKNDGKSDEKTSKKNCDSYQGSL